MIEPGWLGLNRRILVAVKRACWGFFAIGPVYTIILGTNFTTSIHLVMYFTKIQNHRDHRNKNTILPTWFTA